MPPRRSKRIKTQEGEADDCMDTQTAANKKTKNRKYYGSDSDNNKVKDAFSDNSNTTDLSIIKLRLRNTMLDLVHQRGLTKTC